MKRILAVAAVIVFACTPSSEERAESSSAALTLPTSLPLPAVSNGSTITAIWQGSTADLYVADAWASCSFIAAQDASSLDETPSTTIVSFDGGSTPANPRPPGPRDSYMDYVLGLMQTVTKSCPQATDPNPFAAWLQQRGEKSCNVDASGHPLAAPLQPVAVPSLFDSTTGPPSTVGISADAIIRAPGIDACVAQALRSVMPGAAGPAVLTLPASEQRELLEYTRERAQQAVLGYARLTHLVMTTRDPLKPSTYDLQVVQNWFQDPVNGSKGNSRVNELGTQFASSLQLLTTVSTELVELYGRSASARIPRGGPDDKTAAAEQWGSGSWRQRAFGLLYGGDPLSVGQDPNATWTHFDKGTQPGTRWPSVPYVSQDVSEPQIQTLLQIAQQYDLLELKQAKSTGLITVDIDKSANRLYRAVEAAIETSDCDVFNSGANTCSSVTPESLADPTLGYTNFVLWKKHRISYAHATRLVTLLSQETGQLLYDGSLLINEFAGSADVLGVESVVTHSVSPDTGSYYHVAKDAPFLNRITAVRQQGIYSGNGSYDLRETFFAHSTSDEQGFGPSALEQRRILGVVPTLSAAREEIFLANKIFVDGGGFDQRSSLLTNRKTELNLISGAIGDNSIVLEYPSSSLDGSASGVDVTITGNRGLVVYSPDSDTSWGQSGTSFLSTKLPRDGGGWLTPAVFIEPTAVTFGGSTQTTAIGAGVASGPITGSDDLPDIKRPLKRWVFGPIATSGFASTLAVAHATSPSSVSYTYVGGPFGSNTSAFQSSGGSLNTTAERLLKVEEQNPSLPKYDGFGLPIRWVPPTDPTLMGAPPGTSSVTAYLDDAQRAADGAVRAVTEAFQTLLTQQQATLDIQAQAQKSAEVIRATNKALCGDNNPKCNLAVVDIQTLSTSNLQHENDLFVTCKTAVDAGEKQLACATQSIFKAYKGNGKLGVEVVNALQTANSAFDAYAGGRLQEIFINEYFGYTRMQQQLEQVFTAYKVADSHRDTAQKALAVFNQQQSDNCSPIAFAAAVLKGTGVSTGFASATVSFNLGPMLDQIQKCKDLTAQAPVENAKAVEAFAQSVNDMANEALTASDAAKQLSLSVAQGNEAIEGAKLSREQADSDVAIEATKQIANTALFRRFHDFDVWRAGALLESARRYAVAARRAIEARFVVDLSSMQENEPFVASPATWADQIYQYDLSAPTAVGLTATTATAGGVYPNAIVDYVGNLQRFVKGYAVQRPTATTQGDSDVISLPGPLGSAQQGSLPKGVIDDSAYKWSYFCPGDAAWHTIQADGNVDGICSKVVPPNPPTLAKLEFGLDPWARLDGSVARDPYIKRFNERWGRVVVNLVGTGVLDCAKAADPLTCYSQAFIRYDLTHTGPGWLTDFDQNWRSLGVPVGQVEGAKALAAEEWLDPLANGWSKPFVSSIARSELSERPFGGGYQITLHLGPEAVLSHIERVQLLIESAYWVKQQ